MNNGIKAILVFLAFILQGCSSLLGVYNPDDRPESELAFISVAKKPFTLKDTFIVNITSVLDENGQYIFGKGSANKNSQGVRRSLKLKPGQYRLNVQFTSGLGYGSVQITAELEPGDNLVLSCEFAEGNYRKAEVKLVPYEEYYRDSGE